MKVKGGVEEGGLSADKKELQLKMPQVLQSPPYPWGSTPSGRLNPGMVLNSVSFSLKGSTSHLLFGISKFPASLLFCFGTIIK